MPPPGGYPEVLFRKGSTSRGPEGWVIWAAAMGVVGVGFYRVGQCNLERNAWKKEKRDARLAIIPYLQAEEDARFAKQIADLTAEEAQAMAGVKGWEPGASVYHDGGWVAPAGLAHPRPGV